MSFLNKQLTMKIEFGPNRIERQVVGWINKPKILSPRNFYQKVCAFVRKAFQPLSRKTKKNLLHLKESSVNFTFNSSIIICENRQILFVK